MGTSSCPNQFQIQFVGGTRLKADGSGKHQNPGVWLKHPLNSVILGQHVPTGTVGRHWPWAMHSQFQLCPLLRNLGLQAQQQVIVHGPWQRGHQELHFLTFPQPHKAWASPGWSFPVGRQTLYHLKHLSSGILSLPS